jgi:hypothetical protein
MTISLIGLLIALVVVCVLLYCTRLLLGAFAVPQPISTVIYVVVIVICLLIVLQASGLWGPWGTVRIQ